MPDQLPSPVSTPETPQSSPTPEASATPEETPDPEWALETEPELLDEPSSTPTPDPKVQQRKEKRKEFRVQNDEISKELNLTPEQTKLFHQEMKERRRESKAVQKQFAGTLTDQQKSRLKQMRKNGRVSFRALGLSDQQKQSMKTMRSELKRRRQASDQRLNGILTPEQAENYQQLRRQKRTTKEQAGALKGSSR